MIKKIIFDVDNTLLMFDKEYIKYYQDVLKDNGYEHSYDDAYAIFESIGRFEKTGNRYDRNILLNFLNQDLNKNYSLQVVNDLITTIGNNWINEPNSELRKSLEYLFDKYELYVLSNWFTESQELRLMHTKLKPYFKEIIGADILETKPNPASFEYFIKDCNPSECLMIGDTVTIDIDGALSAGMKALLYDYKNQYQDSKYQIFNDWKQIREML